MADMNKKCRGVSNDSLLIWKHSEIFGQKRIEWSVLPVSCWQTCVSETRLPGRPVGTPWEEEEGPEPCKAKQEVKGEYTLTRKGFKISTILFFSVEPIFRSTFQCFIKMKEAASKSTHNVTVGFRLDSFDTKPETKVRMLMRHKAEEITYLITYTTT